MQNFDAQIEHDFTSVGVIERHVVVDGRDSKRQRRRRGHRRRPENVLEPSREVPAAERERRFRGFEAASSDASGR